MKSRLIHGLGVCILTLGGVKSATAQQPGQFEQPMAPSPAVAPARAGRPPETRPAAAPFTLTAEQEDYLNQVLAAWEAHTSKIKTFRCEFTRWTYQPGFIAAEHPQFKDEPGLQSDGEIKYAAPDKGTFKVTEVRRLNVNTGKYDVTKDEVGEHWVSTGDAIYEYDAKLKQVIKRPIPLEMRGRAISDGPLPFLFGAEAEKLKRRYFLRIVTPKEFSETEIWVDAFPRFRGDAANFKRSVLRLKRESFEPFAMRLYDPGNGYSSYEFRSVQINDSVLDKIRDAFKPPLVPFGWRLVVEDNSAGAQPPGTHQPTAHRPQQGNPR